MIFVLSLFINIFNFLNLSISNELILEIVSLFTLDNLNRQKNVAIIAMINKTINFSIWYCL